MPNNSIKITIKVHKKIQKRRLLNTNQQVVCQKQIRNKQSIKKQLQQISGYQISPNKTKFKSTLQLNKYSHEISYSQKYEWVYKQIDYENLSQENILQQNKQLRIALKGISQQVDILMKTLQPKIQKKANKIIFLGSKNRFKTDGVEQLSEFNVQHRKQIQNRQSKNNETTLNMFKNQYTKLKRRQKYIIGSSQDLPNSNTTALVIAHSNRRQMLQSSIDQAIQSIQKIKKTNKKIQQRTKTLGHSIHTTDQFIQNMKRLEYQVQFQEKNKRRLQTKFSQSQENLTQIHKKLFQIQNKYDNAQKYLQQNMLTEKSVEKTKAMQQLLKRKQHLKELADKKKQFNLQNKQLVYHNLLKNLESLVEINKNLDIKIDKNQSQNRNLKSQVKYLEGVIDKIKILKVQKQKQIRLGLIQLTNSNKFQQKQKKVDSDSSTWLNVQGKNDIKTIQIKSQKTQIKDNNKKQMKDKSPQGNKGQKFKTQSPIKQIPKIKLDKGFGDESQISSISEQQQQTKNSPHKNGKQSNEQLLEEMMEDQQ